MRLAQLGNIRPVAADPFAVAALTRKYTDRITIACCRLNCPAGNCCSVGQGVYV